MKKFAGMSTKKFAAFISAYLRKNGVENVLTGGGCATIYSNEKYFSGDLDFVNINYTPLNKINEVLKELGFSKSGRGFKEKYARQTIDIVKAPVSIGEEKIERFMEIHVQGKLLKMLTPTDCVKDRLAAFYYWHDQQALETALLVCEDNEIDLNDIRYWSKNEGMVTQFKNFAKEYLKRCSK